MQRTVYFLCRRLTKDLERRCVLIVLRSRMRMSLIPSSEDIKHNRGGSIGLDGKGVGMRLTHLVTIMNQSGLDLGLLAIDESEDTSIIFGEVI